MKRCKRSGKSPQQECDKVGVLRMLVTPWKYPNNPRDTGIRANIAVEIMDFHDQLSHALLVINVSTASMLLVFDYHMHPLEIRSGGVSLSDAVITTWSQIRISLIVVRRVLFRTLCWPMHELGNKSTIFIEITSLRHESFEALRSQLPSLSILHFLLKGWAQSNWGSFPSLSNSTHSATTVLLPQRFFFMWRISVPLINNKSLEKQPWWMPRALPSFSYRRSCWRSTQTGRQTRRAKRLKISEIGKLMAHG